MKADFELAAVLGVTEPERPVNRAELATYVFHVIQAERARLARIVEDPPSQHRSDVAVAVRGGNANEDRKIFRWD